RPISEYRLCFPSDMTLHDRLPSSGITRLHQYYAVIRLPATRLPSSRYWIVLLVTFYSTDSPFYQSNKQKALLDEI
ncbi:MAG: hypothetical protein IKD59_05955, partial [Lachnospiraceae bacterium]|nr:hypothetical protein [Lachnospiraceae bacterium]